jgi:hypothetical protein
MRIDAMIVDAGFADSRKAAQRLMKQGGVRFGKLLTFERMGANDEPWEAEYYGREYIELYDKRNRPPG